MDFFIKLITSSQDPKRLSLAVRGAVLAIAPILMLVSGATQDEVNSIVDSIEKLAFWGASIVSSGMVVYGLIRKVINRRWYADK